METKDCLIRLCSAFLHEERVTLDKDVDYASLYRTANAHNLSAVLYSVLNTAKNKEVISPQALCAFQNDFLEAVVRYDYQSGIIGELEALFTAAGVRYVFFKGAVLRYLYPVPEARPMGDIDVLIDETNRERVKALLSSHGYAVEAANGPVWEYTKDGVRVEVHTKIISGKVGNAPAEEVFSDAMEHASFDGYKGTLNANYHFAYLIAHIAHHFWFYGAGVKMVLDLAIMQKAYGIDDSAVFALLEKARLAGFAKVLLTVCYEWFGVGQDYGANTAKTKDFLLTFGAFGNVNRNRSAVIERKEMEEGKTTGGIVTRLRLLFPSYDKMKNIPYIRFIGGKPYLTPAAWVYRIGYNLKHRRAFVKEATAQLGRDTTTREATKELAYFEEIGLL